MAGNQHPGFAAVADQIANREGVSNKAADAILASSSRKASPDAKKANPRLKRVGNTDARNAAIDRRMEKTRGGK